MVSAQWNPLRDILSMRDEMNRLFNEFFGRSSGPEGFWSSSAWSPPVDMYDAGDALVLRAELPGCAKEDLSIELKEQTLTLRGERKPASSVGEEQYHRRECACGPFQRNFFLPTAIDQERVTASFKDGILELRLPKSEAAKPKRIAITGARSEDPQARPGPVAQPATGDIPA
jgi:HSP20 family protein